MGDKGLQFPLREERILRLVYLPSTLTNYNNEYLAVNYSGFDCVYNTTYSVEELFKLYVDGKESKIKYIPTEFSTAFDQWVAVDERKYSTTTNPYETLHAGEPYTYFDFHRTVTDEYEFQFQLTDDVGKALENQVIWMEIGFKPKAGLNYKVIDWEDENGDYIDSEALGTAWFTDQGQGVCLGPGVMDYDYSMSRMYTRPETWEYLDPETGLIGEYSSYYWDYRITDTTGLVSFNVSFDENYIDDHHRIFDESLFSSGSITFDSLDDYRLYVRVFHAPIYDIGNMAFEDTSQLYCSQDNKVFNMSRISEFDEFDYSESTFYSGSYGEGLITLHPEDIMLGVPNLLIYQLGSKLNDTFSFTVEIAEADVIPDAELMTLGKLEQSFESNNLVLEYENNTYLIDEMPIIATITDYYGNSVFDEGNVQFSAYIDSFGLATFNISDYYLLQLDPGVYQVSIFTIPREYTKEAYRFITLEVRPENWMKFGEPTMTLDLLNWFDSGWGGAYFGNDYAFYEDIYPRLTGYLATLHSEEGISDYVDFSLYAKARNISDTTEWDEVEWIELGDEDIYLSSLVYDGLYYFEYPLGQDGEMLMGKEIILNITANAFYNQTGMIEGGRKQELYILNLTLVNSTIRNDSLTLRSYSDTDSKDMWIGRASIDPYGVERYFEYNTEENTYGIDPDDVLLKINGYNDVIEIVEVRGQWQYNETILKVDTDYEISPDNDYTIIIKSQTNLDNYSYLIISYAIELSEDKVMNFTFSESEGFEFSEIILDTQNNPIELDHDKYLGVFYSKFNESYELDGNDAVLNIGFSGIETTDVKIFNVTDLQGQEIDDTYILSTDNEQITIIFGTTIEDVFIEYGIVTYSLDRGYQRIGMNYTDSVRKLSKFHDSHKLYNYSSSADVNLLTIPDEPQDPIEAGQPRILIPLLEDNKTSISFNYLALLFDSVLNGSFYLDDCVLSGDVQDLKPILATFTFTTEDGESYFDFVTIDPATGENRFDFEINLQPMYAVHGYTTYDIEIDFISYGDNPNTLQYILFDKFELTADDRILQVVDKPMRTKKDELDISQVINTAHYTQIFTDNLNEAYDVIDNALVTIAVEGLGDYGELVKLYRDEYDQLTFESIEDNEYCFQNLASHDNRLVDSLGLHIDAYDLEVPEYIEGEVNLYAGNGTYSYGEVYESLELGMNWDSTGYSDYTVDIDSFNAHDYNSDNFLISTLPLTGDYMYVEGELYLHHRIDLTTAELITSGLPANIEFAIVLPNTTNRIDSFSVKNIDRICHPWDWVESYQGFALTEGDYNLFNPDLAETYNPSSTTLDEGVHYELVINDEGRDQLNFKFKDSVIINELMSNVIQIDFHIDYEFTESDYAIEEDSNTYNSEIHWQLPDDSYLYWYQFDYHPDLTETTTFNASFFRLSDYAPMADFESSTIETFQFYPNEYNFTTFEFTSFTDDYFEVSLDLTYGGEFEDINESKQWDRIKPFGITIQTESGEKYFNDEFIYGWQHSAEPEHEYEPVYIFLLSRFVYEYLGLLNDTEVMITYYYQKEGLSYYTQHDDILYGGDYTFIIKDSEGTIIEPLGNVSSIVGNNITFTDNILIDELLDIGENFTVEYSFKTRGGLLDTKHFFVEVQPWDMKFYNSYYPFSGASILSPLYYNLSANYQYQLALNYRLQEKSILTFSLNLTTDDIQSNNVEYFFDENIPVEDYDETPTAIVYFYNADGEKVDVIEDLIECSFTSITINDIGTELGLIEEDIIYVSIIPKLHNKYQPFHNLIVNLTTDSIILTNWTLGQDAANNLIANFETPYYIYNVDPYEATSTCKGRVKQIYAILNETNSLTYYLTEDLNDPVDGWQDYDTLIMKLGFLNYEILDYLNVSFYYEDGGIKYIGSVNVTLDMIDTDSGEVNIELPDSSSFSQFTVDNNAHITFTPIFYEHTDFLGFFYEEGYPTFQLVEWNSEDAIDGLLNIDLDSMAIDGQSILVYNDLMEYLYEITDVNTRTEEYNYDGSTETYTLEFNNISLLEVFTDANDNTLIIREGDILYLKYNASLEKSIGITVEDMVLQKSPYIKNYDTGLSDIPIAEISLLGINNDGIAYSTDDLYENREKVVAWGLPLDLTPFESKIENTYKQQVFNVSFEDIYTDFKVLDSYNIENCYITDILITSNDPRYELVIDSIFLFEFDENATLYDSEIFDIYPSNHIENFYVGNYSDIYNESIILDASEFLPLYSDDNSIDETLYFDVYDNFGNWYYFESHLVNESLGAGIYNITWNPQYSEEYYYAYINQYEDLADLYEFYNPHIDTFRYLYISWADEDAWSEWQTIEQINVNSSTLDITFEWYNETIEEYESVIYNQTLSEFETRHIAVEPIYPYYSSSTSDIFELSQDYSNAQDLDIYKITGYFFNETEKVFDISLSNIQEDKKWINITAPDGFNLDNFEKIIVYLNFTEGAYSDYTQFRLLQNAIDNHPEAPLWTKNDSIYIDFEYSDIDYFLLIEDYAVGSEDSMFEYFEYVRNDKYVSFDYLFDKLEEIGNFDSFTEVNDLTSVLELHDYDLDGAHELVIQKDDVSNSGLYDSFKYGSLNPAGEISFHTLVQEASTIQVYKDQSVDYSVSEGHQINWKDIWRKYYIFARRYLTTYTTVINTISSAGKLIQKDLDGDGIPDKELFFRATFSITEVMTVSNETTHLHFKPTCHNPFGSSHDGYLIELRNSTTTYSSQSLSFMFKDFEGDDAVSTRLYEDIFPNELSEIYNLENNLYSVTNDQNDEDPDNDITIDSPALEELLSLSHDTDPVSAIFDQVSMFENDEFTMENILAVNKSLTASGIYNLITGIGSQDSEHDLTISVIEVKPNEGVYYDINTRFGPQKIEGSYYYFDENNDGRYSTIFVADADDNIIGIGFDNDKNLIFEPNDRQFVEKHIVSGGALGWKKFDYTTGEEYYVVESYIKNKLVYFQDEDRYEGYFLEPTLSDSLFDVWKMQYNKGSSKLIKEQMSITSHQFLSSITPSKFWGDVGWQLQAQGISIAVGLALKYAFYAIPIPGAMIIGEIMYYVGHFITYVICNTIHSYIQERDQDYYIRAQTFHNVDYEGEEKLSDKLKMDRYFGDVMTEALIWGSSSGTYAPVRTETDKHAYSGEVILAPRGKTKTSLSFTLDVSFKKLALDYSQQTRGYFAYSDLDDPRFISFFYKEVIEGNSIIVPISRNNKDKYMGNSIMYLEDMVHDATMENDDTHYDSIAPYMVYGDGTFVPVLQFADSEGGIPVPEFYDEYPIFLSPEQYALLDDDEYHSIYKIYSGGTDVIQLIPEYSTHTLHSDIVSFEAYLCVGEDTEIPIGNYKNSENNEIFTFNSTSGQITLLPSLKNSLDNLLISFDGVERYFVLEFFIEKYRSIDDLRDLTAEEVENIATMQSAHANILEYMYQHTIATKTQQKLSEAAYTVLVTVISTLPFAIAGAIGGFGKGIVKGLYQFPKMLISETLEELFLDPWIESAVSGYAEEHGWNTLGKSLAVSFAESGRETFGSSIASGFKNVFSTSTQASNEINSGPESQADKVKSAEQTKAERLRSLLRAISLTALSTIMLFAGFISPVATIFGTSATFIGMAAISTVKEIRYKNLLNKIIDSYSEDNVQNLLGILSPSKVADPQTALLNNELSHITNKENSLVTNYQKNKDKSEGLLQKTYAWLKQHKKQIAMYAGVAIAGFLTTIGVNALFADSMFGSLAGSVTSMGLGTIGMVKQQDSTPDKDAKKIEVQQTLDGKSLLPSKSERVISRDYGGKQKHTQDFLRKAWKLGKVESQYVFGMVYMWKHEKNGKTFIYPGRTERRKGSPFYRPYSSISVRFQEEINTAIYNEPAVLRLKPNQMYYDMHMVYMSAGGGQQGINAIVDSFELEIVEIQLISDNYDYDCKMIERLEDYWMDRAKELGELYAAAGGHAGAHVAEGRSGHARRRLEARLFELFRHGYSKSKIAEYLSLPTLEEDGYYALDNLINSATNGKTWTAARDEYIYKEILNLIDSGIWTLNELASYFRGMDKYDLFAFLARKDSTLGNLYLKGLISSVLLGYGEDSYITYAGLMKELGVPTWDDLSLTRFMRKEMKGKRDITKDDLIQWIGPYASMIVKHFDTPMELLKYLNLDDKLPYNSVNRMMFQLFGMTFEKAKKTFTAGYLGFIT